MNRYQMRKSLSGKLIQQTDSTANACELLGPAVAAIAEDLLDRAAAGPQEQTKAERRVTGRTSAASAGRDWPTPTESPAHDGPSPSDRATADNETADEDGDMAEIIPLPVFDARKEAQTWRL